MRLPFYPPPATIASATRACVHRKSHIVPPADVRAFQDQPCPRLRRWVEDELASGEIQQRLPVIKVTAPIAEAARA